MFRKIYYSFLNPTSISVALSSLKNYEKKFTIKKFLNLVDQNNSFNGIKKVWKPVSGTNVLIAI